MTHDQIKLVNHALHERLVNRQQAQKEIECLRSNREEDSRRVYSAIVHSSGISTGELAERFHLRWETTRNIVLQLESAGVIKRHREGRAVFFTGRGI